MLFVGFDFKAYNIKMILYLHNQQNKNVTLKLNVTYLPTAATAVGSEKVNPLIFVC